MRTILLLAITGACGSSKPAATPANHAEAIAPTAATGTSGMAGLDWGASADAVRAAAPRVTPNPAGGLWATGTTDGITSITSFKLGAHGLEEIRHRVDRGLRLDAGLRGPLEDAPREVRWSVRRQPGRQPRGLLEGRRARASSSRAARTTATPACCR